MLAAGGPTGTAVDENLTASGRWEQVVFYDGGERFDPACSRFPVLAKAMAAIPEATTQGPGAVCLSWLYPGTHVKPHCGRSNAYLRVHLGLRVPGLARMRVGSQTVTWQEGGCLVFDDSFEHEVWNDGDEPRVVLLFDVWHPGLSAHRRTALAGLRPNIHDKILAFMVERNLTRIETHADDLRLVPNDRLTGLIPATWSRPAPTPSNCVTALCTSPGGPDRAIAVRAVSGCAASRGPDGRVVGPARRGRAERRVHQAAVGTSADQRLGQFPVAAHRRDVQWGGVVFGIGLVHGAWVGKDQLPRLVMPADVPCGQGVQRCTVLGQPGRCGRAAHLGAEPGRGQAAAEQETWGLEYSRRERGQPGQVIQHNALGQIDQLGEGGSWPRPVSVSHHVCPGPTSVNPAFR